MTSGCRAIAVGSRGKPADCRCRINKPAKQMGPGRTIYPTQHVRNYLFVIARFVVHVFVLGLKFFIMAEFDLEVLFTLVHDHPIFWDKT